MKAELLLREKRSISDEVFVELVIWILPAPSRGSSHGYKYRLALVENDTCVLRYDNEAGKGDHRHLGELETRYEFRGIPALLDDFDADVSRWRSKR